MAETRIAHVSDLHVPSRWPRAPWLYVGKRAIGALNYKVRRAGQHPRRALEALVRHLVEDASLDHVVVTGDLTNVAFPVEFEAARAYLRPLIERAPGFVSVVPGNHDRYTYVSARRAYFEKTFADCIATELDAGETEGALYPYVRFRGDVALLGLDSAIATPPLFASGTLGEAQRARLARLLEHPRVRAARFRLVLVHHPPLNQHGERDRALHRLTDDRELLELSARLGIDLILTGHIHDAFSIEHAAHGRVVRGIGAGSSTRVDARPHKLGRIHVYTIRDGALAGVETRVFDPDKGHYVPGP